MKKDIRKFLKKHFKANPLSYIGYLGWLGAIGILFAPVLIPFLLCFFFFSYTNVIADELFWENVHKAATKSFWSVFSVDVVIVIILFFRSMAYVLGGHKSIPVTVEGNTVTLSAIAFEQIAIGQFAFYGSIILMVLVFVFCMMKLKKQEKQMLEEDDV